MNKVISFGNEVQPTQLQLKLMAYNILEYSIKEANRCVYPDMDPDRITIKDTGRFYCSWNYVEKINSVIQTIEIDTNYDEKYDNYITEVRKFAKTYNISSDLAIYVFVTLHECGHMANNIYINDRLNGELQYYNAMQDNIESSIFLALGPHVDDGEYDEAYDYHFNPVESVANQFAYKNFKRAWDMLVSRGLISQ